MLPLPADEIRTLIGASKDRLCEDYKKLFVARTQATTGDEADAWRLLSNICDLYLPWDRTDDEPFRGLIFLAAIPDESFLAAAETAKEVDDPELVARCYDVYWVRRQKQKRERRDIDFARGAMDAYVLSARQVEDATKWPPATVRLQRALALARQLNMKDKFAEVLAEIEAMLSRHRGRDPLFLSLRLMELLFHAGAGDPKACVEFCDAAATLAEADAEKRQDYQVFEIRARQYLDMQIKWLERMQEDSVAAVWQRVARNYERAATMCAVPGKHAVAGHFQEKAVECLRRARAEKEVISNSHKRLLELQKLAVGEMKPISVTVDLARFAKEATARVEGKPFIEALFGLMTCAVPPSADAYREWVTRDDGLVAHRLMPSVQINRDGKNTAKRDAVDDDPASDATYAEMVSRARHAQTQIAFGSVIPAIRVFQASYPLRRDELEILVGDSPIVPRGRYRVLARALHAGFVDDWMVVAHLLPPQIEHLIRRVFEENGVIASGLARSVQHEHDLNKLLWLPEAEKILGDDWLLDLRTTLIHPWGANVRNLMAHGLLNDVDFATAEVIYLWWLGLRLIFLHAPPFDSLLAKTDEEQPLPAADAKTEDLEYTTIPDPGAPTPTTPQTNSEVGEDSGS